MRRARRGPRSSKAGLALLAICALPAVAVGEPASDRAEAVLAEVMADREAKALAAQPIAKARDALERAEQALATGDAAHARILRQTGDEWALTARDLVRAARAEEKAEKVERSVQQLETKLVRARALLEETIARRGRAQERLEQLEKGEAAAPEAASKDPAAAEKGSDQ